MATPLWLLVIASLLGPVAATAPRLAHVQPSQAPPAGGTLLTVTGNFFERDNPVCRFARVYNNRVKAVTSGATWKSPTRVVCAAPQWTVETCDPPEGCLHILTVSNGGREFSAQPLGFGGTHLKFLYVTAIPTIPRSHFVSNYASTSSLDQFFAGSPQGYAQIAPPLNSLAQGFIPRKSTLLSSVSLPLSSSPAQLELQVQLNGLVLASSFVTLSSQTTGNVVFSFSDVSLYKGDQGYRLRLSCVTSCTTGWRYGGAGYSHGAAYNSSAEWSGHDFLFETYMRDVTTSYQAFGKVGKSVTEPLELSGIAGIEPVRAPWLGGLAVTVTGSDFQQSEHLWCHVINVVAAVSQLQAVASQELSVGSPIVQSFSMIAAYSLQRAQLHLRLAQGAVWCTVTVNSTSGVVATKRLLVVANTTLDSQVEFVFASPPTLEVGNYSLSLEAETNGISWRMSSTDVLAGAMAYNASTREAIPGADMAFELWVGTDAVLNSPAYFLSDTQAACAVPTNGEAVDKRTAMIKVSNVNQVASASDGYVPFTYHVCAESAPPAQTINYVAGGSPTSQSILSGLAQSFIAPNSADIVSIGLDLDVGSRSVLELKIMSTAPNNTLSNWEFVSSPAILSTSTHTITELGQGIQFLYPQQHPNLQAGQQYWFVVTQVSGSLTVRGGAGYVDGHASVRTDYHSLFSDLAWDMSFVISQCAGCGILDPSVPNSGYSAPVGAFVNSTDPRDERTEQARSQAAQSFTAEITGLISHVELDLAVSYVGAGQNFSDICLWVTTGAPHGAAGYQDVPNGVKCLTLAIGTDGFVTFEFVRAIFVDVGTIYFLTLKHGRWFSATSKWAQDANSDPVSKQMHGRRLEGPSQPATWRGASGNHFWPGQSGLTGQAYTKSEGDTATWTSRPDHDLRFKAHQCQSGLPTVVNMTIEGVQFATGPWLGSPRYGVAARTSTRGDALLTIFGHNFFPSESLTCRFHLADGSPGPTTRANVVQTDFRKATCRTPKDFDPYAGQDCTGIGSCLGVYVTVSNDNINFGSITGPSRASMGASTPKLLVSDLYVSATTGQDTLGDGTMWRPFMTIQRAIAHAGDVDQITLLGSTHQGDGSNSLLNLGKDIHIRAQPGETSTINCTFAPEGAVVLSQETQDLWASISANSFPENTGTISMDSSVTLSQCTGHKTIVN